MDLGMDPSAFIRYPGGNGFYFDATVEETLTAKGVEFSTEDIEGIFAPFLKPQYRVILKKFRHRQNSPTKVRCGLDRVVPDQRDVHIFDARRLYYLRFGRIDSGELGTRHWKWLNVFLSKSRDEIEGMLDAMERELPPGEYATYAYSSLGVSLFFPQYLRDYPYAMDRGKVDEYVVDALCRLNSDKDFFLGVEDSPWNGLHPYLSKYAWLYFDSEFQPEIWSEGFWFNTKFNRPTPPPSRSVPVEAACELFGISVPQFQKMSKKELARFYRRKAKKMHPDHGGVHEDFVKLSEAYERLLAMK